MTSPAEISDEWYANTVASYLANAAAVFMIYDYLLNTGREVEVFWRRPITAASILFFSNKCMTLLKHLLDWLTPLGTSDESRLIIADFVVEILQLLPWGAFSAMRALALSRSRPLSILVFLLSVIPMGVNFIRRFFQYLFRYGMDGTVDPLTGCQMHQEIHIPHELTIKYVYTYTTFALSHSDVIIMQMYYILHIFGTGGASGMSSFIELVTGVLVSRFLLDLQEADQCRNASSVDSESTLRFATSQFHTSTPGCSR
ncbi:hypothetical protein C8Q74DRAFT_1215799 [Fomes fomentarius]|nr:hypothetical protein C8Q74DRAFT_1215799 [Fomes fomentarius]